MNTVYRRIHGYSTFCGGDSGCKNAARVLEWRDLTIYMATVFPSPPVLYPFSSIFPWNSHYRRGGLVSRYYTFPAWLNVQLAAPSQGWCVFQLHSMLSNLHVPLAFTLSCEFSATVLSSHSQAQYPSQLVNACPLASAFPPPRHRHCSIIVVGEVDSRTYFSRHYFIRSCGRVSCMMEW